MSRDDQSDTRRNEGGPAMRDSFMIDMEELMEPNTIAMEVAAKQVVGPNAPVGGNVPPTYTIGSRGGVIQTVSEDTDPD